MEEWGNQRANEYFEANIPPNFVRPKEGDPVRVVEKFIRDKYEHKKYMAKTPPPPKGVSNVPSGTETPALDIDSDGRMNTPSPVPSGNVRFASGSPAPVAPTRAAAVPTKPVAAAVNLLDFDAAPPTAIVGGFSGATIQQSPSVPDVAPPSIPSDVFSGFGNAVSNSHSHSSFSNGGNSPNFMMPQGNPPAVPSTGQQHVGNNGSSSSVNSAFSDFSNFNTGSARPTPPPPSAANDIFAAFSNPATAVPSAASPGIAATKPSPSIDIMSLYGNNNAPNNMMRGGMGGAPGGMMMGGGAGGGMNMMGSPHMMGMNNMGGNMGMNMAGNMGMNNMGGNMGMNMGGNMGMNNMGGNMGMNNMGGNMGAPMGMPPQQRGSVVGNYGPGMGVASNPTMPMNTMGMAMGNNMGNVRTTSPMPNSSMGGFGMGNPGMMGGQSPMMYGAAAPQQTNIPTNAFAGFGNVGSTANNNQRQW